MRFNHTDQHFHSTGTHQPTHHHEHKGDRPGCIVRQNAKRFLLGQDAQKDHGRRAKDCRYLDRKGLAHKQHEHREHDPDGNVGLGFLRQFDAEHTSPVLKLDKPSR